MIDGAAFFQDYDLDMIIIIQVPRANKQVQLDAAMSAYRYFAFAPVGIQRNIEQFSKAIIQFFKGGTPISDERTWDLTPRLIELDGE